MRNLKLSILLLSAVLAISSCKSDDDSDVTTNSTEVKAMLTDYVNNVVRSTYHNLADATIRIGAPAETLQAARPRQMCRLQRRLAQGTQVLGSRAKRSSTVPPHCMASTRTSTRGLWTRPIWTICSATPTSWLLSMQTMPRTT